MNGILVVDKPEGFTSFDVVAKLRGICATRKIGHGGTLDPMATGVLPVFVGPAVKAVDIAPRQDKRYDAQILFGLSTDTGDITGQVLESRPADITLAAFEAVLPRFWGRQQQTPPMYSAVKVNGRPLYSYAREGQAVQRKPREIEIFSIKPTGSAAPGRFNFEVHCSKGTYIRTLVEDIGAALGLPATLAALRRTAAGAFALNTTHTLQAIQAARDSGRLDSLVLPVESVFSALPRCTLDSDATSRLMNGAPVRCRQLAAGRYAAYGPQGFTGLVQVDGGGILRGEKLFVQRGE